MSSNLSKPTPRTDARIVTGLLLLFLVMTGMAYGYPPVTRSFPLLVGAVGSLLSAVECVRLWQRARLAPHVAGESQRDRLAMFGWVAAALGAMSVFGLVTGGALFAGVFLRVRERESWLFSLLGATGVVVVLHVILERVFGVTLYSGLLWAGLW